MRQLRVECSDPGIVLRFTLYALCIFLALLPTPARASVTVSSFEAQAQGAQILLRWTTASEINNAGFNLLRSTSQTGTYAKIAGLIPTKCLGCITGASYSYTDSAVTPGQTYFYKLQSVDNAGKTELFGPASAAASAPSPTPTATRSPTATRTRTPTRTLAPATPTHTLAPGAPTLTRTPTLTPSPVPVATKTLPATKVAIARTPPTATPARPVAGARFTPTIQATPIPTPVARAVKEPEPTDVDLTERESVEPIPADSRTPLWITGAFVGLAGLFGCGSLLFGAIALLLLARTLRQ